MYTCICMKYAFPSFACVHVHSGDKKSKQYSMLGYSMYTKIRDKLFTAKHLVIFTRAHTKTRSHLKL